MERRPIIIRSTSIPVGPQENVVRMSPLPASDNQTGKGPEGTRTTRLSKSNGLPITRGRSTESDEFNEEPILQLEN